MRGGCNKTINELRVICQKSRYESEGGIPWFEKNFYRRFSIYFTKLFILMGISANTTTLLSLLSALVGGLFLIFADSIFYFFISSLFLILYLILDRADGEISRYTKTSSKFGEHFDLYVGVFVHAYLIGAISLGAYLELKHPFVLGFGYLAVSLNLLSEFCRVFPKINSTTTQKIQYNSRIYRCLKHGKSLFGPGTIIYPLLFVTLMDTLFEPMLIFTNVNMRYAFLIVYSCLKLPFIIKDYKRIL